MELIEQLDKLAEVATEEAMEFPADEMYLMQVMRRLANQASLISASPDLLEVLEYLKGLIYGDDYGNAMISLGDDDIARIDSAIDKARGEA